MKVLNKWKKQRRQRMLDKSIKYFHEGKFDRVKKIIEKLEWDRQGDVEAMKMLISGLCVDDIEQAREIYGRLWDSTEFGFLNDKIAREVELKLAAVTHIVLENAKEDIAEIYKLYQSKEKEAMFRACKQHASYGHPDAVALQIWGYMEFGCDKESPEYYYRDYVYDIWLRRLKMATQKGISPEFKEHTQVLVKKLEILAEPKIIIDPPEVWPPHDGIDDRIWGDF